MSATNPNPPVITGGSQDQAHRSPRSPWRIIKGAILLALITACGVNLWTGGPLFALWVGSRLAGTTGHLTLGIVGVTALTLFAIDFALYRLLAFLSCLYNRCSGRRPAPRRRAAWLRSMRDSDHVTNRDQHITAPEAIVVTICLAAVVGFEIWFFFSAGNPLGPS